MGLLERSPIYCGIKCHPTDLNLPMAQEPYKKAVEDLLEYGSKDNKIVRSYLDRTYKGTWPLKEVKTDRILFVQEWLVPERLINYPDVTVFPADEPIMLAEWQGTYMVLDGNHRSAIAIKYKKPNVMAAVLPVNKLLERYMDR